MSSLTLKRALGGAIAATALAVAPAGAASVAVGGGATTLKLDPAAGKALTSLGVKVAPVKPAAVKGGGVAFPITGGTFDPKTAAGRITHSGGLRLSAGRVKLALTDFDVSTTKKNISVKVNGGPRLEALVLVLKKAKISRAGLGYKVSGIDVHLSSAGAKALNATFHVSAFKPRLKLGTVTVVAVPKTVTLAGGRTDLVLDPGAASALTSLGVTPGLTQGAKANRDGSFGFPITKGAVDANTLAGEIDHSGGITLTKGGTTVALTDYDIDTKSGLLSAKISGGDRADILSLGLRQAKVTIAGRRVTIAGVPAHLTQGAADALNQAFGTGAFKKNLKLGTATVRAIGA